MSVVFIVAIVALGLNGIAWTLAHHMRDCDRDYCARLTAQSQRDDERERRLLGP